jgi:hypothetical protein
MEERAERVGVGAPAGGAIAFGLVLVELDQGLARATHAVGVIDALG